MNFQIEMEKLKKHAYYPVTLLFLNNINSIKSSKMQYIKIQIFNLKPNSKPVYLIEF